LHPKITFLVNPVDHERTRVFHHPTLTISRAGFTTINLRLLQDPGRHLRAIMVRKSSRTWPGSLRIAPGVMAA
jgi:hypothetical protein